MSTNTPNYNLTKDEDNEFYDVEVVNENLDKIDTAIKELEEQASTAINNMDEKITQHLAHKATNTEAQTGTDNEKWMTPATTAHHVKSNELVLHGKDAYDRYLPYLREINSWDEVTESGTYKCFESVLAPNWTIGEAHAHLPGYLTLKVWELQGSKEWERTKDTAVWGEWIETSPRLLFQSVSNGKAEVTSAVTDKGVETASDAPYATIAANIRAIPTGGTAIGSTARVNDYFDIYVPFEFKALTVRSAAAGTSLYSSGFWQKSSIHPSYSNVIGLYATSGGSDVQSLTVQSLGNGNYRITSNGFTNTTTGQIFHWVAYR